jgi:hypothetical protein
MLVVLATLVVVAIVLGVRAGSSRGSGSTAGAARTAATAATVVATPSPASRLEQARYQPTALQAVPGPGEVVLSWVLPADARQDGAGIIIHQQPAATPAEAVIALGPVGGQLPETYVVTGAQSGQQYCFTIAVLVQRTGGEPILIPNGPMCAVPR